MFLTKYPRIKTIANKYGYLEEDKIDDYSIYFRNNNNCLLLYIEEQDGIFKADLFDEDMYDKYDTIEVYDYKTFQHKLEKLLRKVSDSYDN